MTQVGINALIEEWIAGQSAGGVGTPEWEAREDLMISVNALPHTNPELAWQVILAVVERRPSDEVLGTLSAGLLEDLITEHGEKFLRSIEVAAEKSPLFKEILAKVWVDSDDTPVWRRIYEIAGVEPPFPSGWRANTALKKGTPQSGAP